jgi:hypothetical protein
MESRNIEIERLSIVSARPFEAVVQTIEASIGRPDMVEFIKAGRSAANYTELQGLVKRSVSQKGGCYFRDLRGGHN